MSEETMRAAEIIQEDSIRFLQACGWMENHDKEITESEYHRGHEAGYNECRLELACEGKEYETAYNRGRTYGRYEAWEAAKKIALTGADDGGIPGSDLREMFGDLTPYGIFREVGVDEVIEKIADYKGKESAEVGDEVIRHWENACGEGDDAPSIFLRETDGDYWECLTMENGFPQITTYPKWQYRKTGRKFPEVTEVLKQMREG